MGENTDRQEGMGTKVGCCRDLPPAAFVLFTTTTASYLPFDQPILFSYSLWPVLAVRRSSQRVGVGATYSPPFGPAPTDYDPSTTNTPLPSQLNYNMDTLHNQIMLYPKDQEPPPPTTIQSLSRELIGRILELAVEDEPNNHRSRTTLLFRASLVCKVWIGEAQVLLWRKVFISNESMAQRLLSTPALGKGYRTKELNFSRDPQRG